MLTIPLFDFKANCDILGTTDENESSILAGIMAKCTICNSRKGKRTCKATGTFVCSLCCGDSRNQDKCAECSFYTQLDKSKNYGKIPYFEIREMQNDPRLQIISVIIERELCRFDKGYAIDDETAELIVERLLDKYHFQEPPIAFKNNFEKVGFVSVRNCIDKNRREMSDEVITKILGAILRSIKRHTNGKREYLDFIDHIVGI
jgi:hypothetical protein